MTRTITTLLVSGLLLSTAVLADNNVIEQRQDLMERTGDAAKVIGEMLKEEQPFDAAAAMAALEVLDKTAAQAGDLFPVGSETGNDTEARSTIWSDPEGFEQALLDFSDAVDNAIVANPASLAELGAAANPVFKTCKGCHENYRVEKDD